MVKTQIGDVDMKHFTPDYKPWDQLQPEDRWGMRDPTRSGSML